MLSSPLEVPCDFCHVDAGTSCVGLEHTTKTVHATRQSKFESLKLTEPSPLDVDCRYCEAKAGTPCRGFVSEGQTYHFSRQAAWDQKIMAESNELKVTKDKVLEVAKTCKDAARILKGLFPEAFAADAEYLYITEPSLESKAFGVHLLKDGPSSGWITTRVGANLARRGLYLPPISGYQWTVVKDDSGADVLVARKKS